ncbi:ATPase [Thiomicrorhabdus immobilis]|uniref:histidine kinase n=1 Tax=Thiomicrorhabdus immobilis TaxID=2791037 RepID=A0ABN6CYH0_9GAMM|nr:sensor histidine kinase [Thiomicrorhabdus immobilis]BCN94147.1 ATPase [Thiomicrorhabdus immobilis]
MAFAQVDTVKNSSAYHEIPKFKGYVDSSNTLTIDDISKLVDSEFQEIPTAGYVGGYNRASHWLKFTIVPPKKNSSELQPLLLRISPPYLDEIILYLPNPKGGFETLHTGDMVEPVEQKMDRTLLLQLPVIEEPTIAYIKLNTINTHTLVADIYSSASYRNALLLDYSLSGIFIGLLVALMFINLGYGQWRKDKSFRYYLLFIIASLLVFVTVHGWVNFFIADKWRILGNYLPQLSTLVYLFILNLLYHSLFEFERKKTPIYYIISRFYLLSVVLGLISLLFDFYIEYMPWFMKLTVLYLLLISGFAFKLIMQKRKEGGWFFLAVAFGFTGILGTALSLAGLVSGGELLMYSYTAGTLGSIVVFQSIMSRRIRQIEKDRISALLDKDFMQEVAQREKNDKEQKERFLSMLSHELKTPLSVMRMGLNQPDLSDRSRQHLLQAVRDMNMVIDRCTVLEKVDSQIVVKQESIELNALVQQQVEQSSEPERIVLSPNSGPVIVESDKDLLQIIMSNLIDNALKYSPHDQKVNIVLKLQSDKACLHVINPTKDCLPDSKQLFTKYYRAKTAHKQTGSGLGLYIVKCLVDQLQAEIFYLPKERQNSDTSFNYVEMCLCLKTR